MTNNNLNEQYTAQINQLFAPFFQQNQFTISEVSCVQGGRSQECLLMAETEANRLLFELSDGAFSIWLGGPQAKFPQQTQLPADGSSGWFMLAMLVEYQTNKKVYTQQIIDQIWADKIDKFAFEADLLQAWAAELLPMVRNGQISPTAFKEHFEQKRNSRWTWLTNLRL